MNIEELLKETYPEIELDDKWDYFKQRFSADDMLRFATEYAEKEFQTIITEVEEMHMYKKTGERESYSQYAEGWSDACAEIEGRINKLK